MKPPPDPRATAETIALARRVSDTFESAYRDAVHELKERLRTQGLRQLAHDGISIIWSTVKGRPSHDMRAIKEAAAAAGIDLDQFETTGEPSDRLVIQDRGQSCDAA